MGGVGSGVAQLKTPANLASEDLTFQTRQLSPAAYFIMHSDGSNKEAGSKTNILNSQSFLHLSCFIPLPCYRFRKRQKLFTIFYLHLNHYRTMHCPASPLSLLTTEIHRT